MRVSRCVPVVLAGCVWGLATCARHPIGIVEGDGGAGDAAEPCREPPLSMAFALVTRLEPEILDSGVERYRFSGQVLYHGPLRRTPPAGAKVDQEVEVDDLELGERVVFQYGLPKGLRLPVRIGAVYVFEYRVFRGMGPLGRSLAVDRANWVGSPSVFLGEAGPQRVFVLGPELAFPVSVTVVPREECEPIEDLYCGGTLYRDQLRFEPVDDPASAKVLVQGQQDTLVALDESYTILNAQSIHYDQTCPDMPAEEVAYLVALTAQIPPECDPSRFYVNDTPDPSLGPGDTCGELTFCVAAPALQVLEKGDFAVECRGSCPEGGTLCRFDTGPHGEIDEAVYAEMCMVSTMENAPDAIVCRRIRM